MAGSGTGVLVQSCSSCSSCQNIFLPGVRAAHDLSAIPQSFFQPSISQTFHLERQVLNSLRYPVAMLLRLRPMGIPNGTATAPAPRVHSPSIRPPAASPRCAHLYVFIYMYAALRVLCWEADVSAVTEGNPAWKTSAVKFPAEPAGLLSLRHRALP